MVQDFKYKNDFPFYADEWKNSQLCRIFGMFACFFCLLSLFTILFITLQKYLVIKKGFKFQEISLIQSIFITLFLFLLSFSLAFFPTYFYKVKK